jgi:hypothetical protein
MATRISITKEFTNDTFDTYVPDLTDNADIQNAFELFYYGNSDIGNTEGDVSLHKNLVDFDTRITSATSGLSGHIGSPAAHGATGAVVGTTNTQILTNKTVNLADNVLSGTTAQFNAALSDANFATEAALGLKPTLSYEGSTVNRNIFVQAAQPTAINVGDIWFDF